MKKQSGMSVFKLIVGVAFGILLAGILSTAAWLFFAGALIGGVVNSVNDKMNAPKTSQIQPANQSQAPGRFYTSIKNQEVIAEQQAQQAQKEAIGEQERLLREYNAAKELKWQAYQDQSNRFKAQYKKPPECETLRYNEQRVKCANMYIEARGSFEKALR